MNQQPENKYPRDDPFIDEIRSIRKEISDGFGNDVGRLCEHLREIEREYPDRVVEPARRNSEENPQRKKPETL